MHVTRRRFLQAGAAGAAGAALLPAAGCTMDQAGSREHMNVLLLIVDSLRPDHVGAYGSDVKTPNLDALIARGVQFTRAYP
jgi:Sulfatase/TAT (twin-arginine translocation) pathway signal sequence